MSATFWLKRDEQHSTEHSQTHARSTLTAFTHLFIRTHTAHILWNICTYIWLVCCRHTAKARTRKTHARTRLTTRANGRECGRNGRCELVCAPQQHHDEQIIEKLITFGTITPHTYAVPLLPPPLCQSFVTRQRKRERERAPFLHRRRRTGRQAGNRMAAPFSICTTHRHSGDDDDDDVVVLHTRRFAHGPEQRLLCRGVK